MKVQTRILLLLLALAAIFIGGLAALKLYQERHFRELAARRAHERNGVFDEFLKTRGDGLTALVDEFALMDSTVRATQLKDPASLKSAITEETLITFEANAVWVYRPDGNLLFSINNRYAPDLQELPVPMAQLAPRLTRDRKCHFYCQTKLGWMEVRGSTIHRSIDSRRETTPQGFLLTGHIWNEEDIRRMVAFTGYELKIVPVDQMLPPLTSAEERGVVQFSRVLPGWDGTPVAQIQVRSDSPIIREMNRLSELLLRSLLVFAVAVTLLLAWCLIAWVRRPLRIISDSLRIEKPERLQALRHRRTEFGRLAELILRFRRTEQELHKTEELLRHSQKLEAVGRLAGGVAHDFNNLLTAIIGYSDMLEKRLAHDSQGCEQAACIRQAGERAASLTRQLLAFSRKQLLQPVVLDLDALLREVQKLLQRVIGEHIAIRLDLSNDDTRVLADATQLEQVILNLGVNARDAMPGGGTLTISTRRHHLGEERAPDDDAELPPGDYVQLCVIDTGSGMSDETRARVFEPFFTTKGPGKGTGLGLATVYGIVKQSGGGISVRSELGRGSTFCIYLPHAKAPLEPAKPAPAPVERVSTEETILVVEDEEVVRDLVCVVLSEYGYRVLCAGTPQEALKAAHDCSGRIDLLVCDVILPEMHGPVIAQRLLEVKPMMRVLFVSGYSENDISDQGVLEPGVEVLQKPFTQQDLLRKIREVLAVAEPVA